jgi:hypothetical protein
MGNERFCQAIVWAKQFRLSVELLFQEMTRRLDDRQDSPDRSSVHAKSIQPHLQFPQKCTIKMSLS